MTSKWEVITGPFLYSFIIIAQITQNFVIGSYIEDIETNLFIGKHTLRVFR